MGAADPQHAADQARLDAVAGAGLHVPLRPRHLALEAVDPAHQLGVGGHALLPQGRVNHLRVFLLARHGVQQQGVLGHGAGHVALEVGGPGGGVADRRPLIAARGPDQRLARLAGLAARQQVEAAPQRDLGPVAGLGFGAPQRHLGEAVAALLVQQPAELAERGGALRGHADQGPEVSPGALDVAVAPGPAAAQVEAVGQLGLELEGLGQPLAGLLGVAQAVEPEGLGGQHRGGVEGRGGGGGPQVADDLGRGRAGRGAGDAAQVEKLPAAAVGLDALLDGPQRAGEVAGQVERGDLTAAALEAAGGAASSALDVAVGR